MATKNKNYYETPMSFEHRIDVVIAAHKRNGTALLKHLDRCLPLGTRVYVYVAINSEHYDENSMMMKKFHTILLL